MSTPRRKPSSSTRWPLPARAAWLAPDAATSNGFRLPATHERHAMTDLSAESRVLAEYHPTNKVRFVTAAALQEDAQGIAISSYQGGHVEYFKYAVDLLRQRGGEHIQVFGGGGGVIVPAEIRELQDYGVARIFSPEDGQRMGLQGMIGEMLMRCDHDLSAHAPKT